MPAIVAHSKENARIWFSLLEIMQQHTYQSPLPFCDTILAYVFAATLIYDVLLFDRDD